LLIRLQHYLYNSFFTASFSIRQSPSALAEFVNRATGTIAGVLAVIQAGAALDLGMSHTPLFLMLGIGVALFLTVV
jgi:hypothetical protein